jgi:hypothetical protein
MKVLEWEMVENRKWEIENRIQKSEVFSTSYGVCWKDLRLTINDN